MKQVTIILIIAAVLIVGIGSYMMISKAPAPAMQTDEENADTTATSGENQGTDTSADTTVPEVRTVEVSAKMFEYSPSQITLKKGQPVKLVITNTDKTHGITIPEFNARGIDSVEFTPNKTGTFEFRCPTMCGTGHRNMTGTIVVTE